MDEFYDEDKPRMNRHDLTNCGVFPLWNLELKIFNAAV